jgi:magnesium-transporting ATPase (P-type)
MQRSPIELGVLKSFEFVSQLRRASVIVRNFGSPGCDIYVKGAPECMKDICKAESCELSAMLDTGGLGYLMLILLKFPATMKIFSPTIRTGAFELLPVLLNTLPNLIG